MPQERLTGEQALHAFTVGAAYASFAENRRGTLAVGRDADFTAFSVDPVDDPAEELRSAKAVLTVVGGAIRHPSVNERFAQPGAQVKDLGNGSFGFLAAI